LSKLKPNSEPEDEGFDATDDDSSNEVGKYYFSPFEKLRV